MLKADEGYLAIQTYYDYQDLRVRSMNRIRALIRARAEGKDLREPEKKKEEKEYDEKYADEKLPGILTRLLQEGKISKEEYDYISSLLDVAEEAKKIEESYRKLMLKWIEGEPMYQRWLKHIKGLGPVLAAGLLYYIDMNKVKHASSLWKYAGLAPVDGHTEKSFHGQKIDYNPKFKVLCWKIADSFIKQRTQPYRELYDVEKERELKRHEDPNYLEKVWDPVKKEWVLGKCKNPKLHSHMRAMRKMIKRFLVDYYEKWREIHGLPPDEPYAVGILGHTKEADKIGGQANP